MRLAVPGTRRGYYGHEVGYGSYFPIGLDPLTILAGLAFLAFIIQTLYLLLYKHYGLGLGASAGVGIGPLSADRHQRDEQQAWANSVASRIDATASTYESGAANGTDGLDTFLSALRRSWSAHTPARDCSPAWLCRLVHWARVLTEPLAALSTYRPRPPPQLQPLSRAAPAPRTPMMATHASSPEPDTGPT
ncbi:hypothetical protein ONE63_010285 [Megalurothrips usitatus]|uniref:Uncharacterized protein n=1 Tax=Megalurothrips usitatus TaxID=439358 RepID=A0AAV7XLK3_9NEOP|nr:hypothetical protein ONE63_010285 [Megalurothrips usitatus]